MHRGGLAESLQTLANIEPTIAALRAYLAIHLPPIGPPLHSCDIELRLHSRWVDKRLDPPWGCTYLVLLDGAPVAFTDGMLVWPQ